MTFLALLTRQAASFENQPTEPAKTCDCGEPATCWSWTATGWEPTCPAHMAASLAHRIYNTEFEEDW